MCQCRANSRISSTPNTKLGSETNTSENIVAQRARRRYHATRPRSCRCRGRGRAKPQTDQAQLQGGGQALGDRLAHGLAAPERAAEVEVHEPVQPLHVLHGIRAGPARARGAAPHGLRRRFLPEDHAHRIARRQPDHARTAPSSRAAPRGSSTARGERCIRSSCTHPTACRGRPRGRRAATATSTPWHNAECRPRSARSP